MGMVPRIGRITSLQSNYHARYLCSPSLWGGLGVVCVYLRRLVGIGIYVYMYLSMYVCIHIYTWGGFLGMGVLGGGDTIGTGGKNCRPPAGTIYKLFVFFLILTKPALHAEPTRPGKCA